MLFQHPRSPKGSWPVDDFCNDTPGMLMIFTEGVVPLDNFLSKDTLDNTKKLYFTSKSSFSKGAVPSWGPLVVTLSFSWWFQLLWVLYNTYKNLQAKITRKTSKVLCYFNIPVCQKGHDLWMTSVMIRQGCLWYLLKGWYLWTAKFMNTSST